MIYQITHIRLSNNSSTSTENISHIKLSNGIEETKAQAVKYIDGGSQYYYTQSTGSRAIVETVHPATREPYLRTKANNTIKDNLLNLPKF
ncbi:DUF3892 domain-containing protein [Bacillus inaquosorum]|uniref:DUF3892 domain-containing protein n=1 Tax=Bacillus subtilis group TaxID=653685 RepID=UPI00227F55C4|nr:DUF3892 domain-containing protein [Bacillus inaquosorum]MCY7908300.1 DUF3892 domain-containing protein [Bacillus inaquosorum]